MNVNETRNQEVSRAVNSLEPKSGEQHKGMLLRGRRGAGKAGGTFGVGGEQRDNVMCKAALVGEVVRCWRQLPALNNDEVLRGDPRGSLMNQGE